MRSPTRAAPAGVGGRTGKETPPAFVSQSRSSSGRICASATSAEVAASVIELPPVAAAAALHDVLEIMLDLLEVVGVVLEHGADHVLDEVPGADDAVAVVIG